MNISWLSDDFSWTSELAMVCAVSALVEHYIPNFNTFNKQKHLDLILNGFDKDNDIFYH